VRDRASPAKEEEEVGRSLLTEAEAAPPLPPSPPHTVTCMRIRDYMSKLPTHFRSRIMEQARAPLHANPPDLHDWRTLRPDNAHWQRSKELKSFSELAGVS
jgi:hypothetical protein